jgi:hypothetical protein
METKPEPPVEPEPGLEEFLKDVSLSGDATPEGNRISEETEVQWQAARSSLLLSGAAKPQGPSSFPALRELKMALRRAAAASKAVPFVRATDGGETRGLEQGVNRTFTWVSSTDEQF